MKKVRIFADSTCDLSKELIEKYKIEILPLYITIGDRTGKDGVEITRQDIFNWADQNRDTPKTSALTPADAINAITGCKERGEEAVFIGISEDMSCTCNVVRVEAEELENTENFHVVNSMNLSSGIGHLVVWAGIMAEEGKSAKEIVEEIENLRSKVKASFVIDTLTYLYRGGRCSAITALLANTLKIKPKIIVENGKMDIGGKYRGNIASVAKKYVSEMEEALLNSRADRVFITHPEMNNEIVEMVKKQVEELNYFKEIHVTQAGGVISSHCGPNTIGVLYLEK